MVSEEAPANSPSMAELQADIREALESINQARTVMEVARKQSTAATLESFRLQQEILEMGELRLELQRKLREAKLREYECQLDLAAVRSS